MAGQSNTLLEDLLEALRVYTNRDTLLLFDLLSGAVSSEGVDQLDGAAGFDENLMVLEKHLRRSHADQRRLALELLQRCPSAHINLLGRVEMRAGLWARRFAELSAAATMVAVLVLTVVFGMGKLQEKTTDNAPVIYGRLLHENADTWVIIERGAEKVGTKTELVLLPDRGRWLPGLDACNLAVLLEAPADPKVAARTGRYRVLDMYYDRIVCVEPMDNFLKNRWGIDLDVNRYPSTFQRRAQQEIEYVRNESDKRLKEEAYTRIKSSLQSAERLLSTASASTGTTDHGVRSRLAGIREGYRAADLDQNSVARKPRHELINITAGYSYRLRRAGRENIRLPEFWIDRYEVANSQFEQLNPAHPRGESIEENMPVLGVSWSEAERYCEQRGFRLPTEDEFEKAAMWDPTRNEFRPVDLQRIFELRSLRAVQDDPSGESAYVLKNTIGNAAEWTIRKIPDRRTPLYVVKGGSFRTATADRLSPWYAAVEKDVRMADVGFRCATSGAPRPNEWVVLRE